MSFTFWSLRCILYRWYITSSWWCKTRGEAGWAENGIEICSKRQMGVWRGPCKITYTRSKTLQYTGVRESWVFQNRALEERIPIREVCFHGLGGRGSGVRAAWKPCGIQQPRRNDRQLTLKLKQFHWNKRINFEGSGLSLSHRLFWTLW